MIQRIAVLTSGGDAPGMNAAIRAITRFALDLDWEVFGVKQGFAGLMSGNFIPLTARAVGGIIQQGGTFLGSARSLEFKTEQGRRKALHNLAEKQIDALIVIGGNGSQTGANALFEMGFPVNGVASTIDNDLAGSDITLGVDTALNIAIEAIDRLKVTASSHQRAFLVEVMGRNCGYLALMSGLAGGAEAVVIPEVPTTPEAVAETIRNAAIRGKTHAIIVVAEGANYNADKLIHYFNDHKEQLGYDLRATTLGHIQRGGVPSAYDRILGTRFGAHAASLLAHGKYGLMAGSLHGEIEATPLNEVAGITKLIDERLIQLLAVMAR